MFCLIFAFLGVFCVGIWVGGKYGYDMGVAHERHSRYNDDGYAWRAR